MSENVRQKPCCYTYKLSAIIIIGEIKLRKILFKTNFIKAKFQKWQNLKFYDKLRLRQFLSVRLTPTPSPWSAGVHCSFRNFFRPFFMTKSSQDKIVIPLSYISTFFYFFKDFQFQSIELRKKSCLTGHSANFAQKSNSSSFKNLK